MGFRLLRLFLVVSLSVSFAAGCPSKKGDDDDTADGDADADADSDGDTDSDADSDADGDADADADGDADCPSNDPCDVYAQCGCADGENCSYNGSDKQCIPAGTGQQDDACSDTTDCDIGLTCLSDLTCAQYCNDAQGVRCPGGSQCTIALGDPDNPEQELARVCATPSNCDPIAQTGCDAAGNACYIVNPQDGTTDCAPEGEAAVGDACVHTNDCAAGATCIGFQGGDGSHCVAHCDADAQTSTCADGTTCQRLVNGQALGVCVPAQG